MPKLVDLVDAIYGAAATGDFDTIETYLTDDFRVEMSPALPFAGVYEGKTALQELFPAVMGALGVTNIERGEYMVSSDSVSYKAIMSVSAPDIEPLEMLEVFRFRGDKLCEIRAYYYNPHHVVSACDANAALAG